MNKHSMNLFFCVVKCGLTLKIVLFRLSSIPSLLDKEIYEAVVNFVGDIYRYYLFRRGEINHRPATRKAGKKKQAEEQGSEEERREEKKEEEAMKDEENDLTIEEEVMEVTFASSPSGHSGP